MNERFHIPNTSLVNMMVIHHFIYVDQMILVLLSFFLFIILICLHEACLHNNIALISKIKCNKRNKKKINSNFSYMNWPWPI